MKILFQRARVYSFLLLAILLNSQSAQAAAVAPGATIEGRTLGEWSAEWWQWALSFPVSNNPLLDVTGGSASLGDVGPVFFLAGTTSSTPVRRNFSVPSGRYIFFPVLNAFLSGEGTVPEMRARLNTFVGNTTELHASVDGVAIPDLFTHREISPVFDITLGADNIYGAPAGVYTPSVSDGFWLMLEPLSPGTHVINFGGSSQNNTDPSFGDITVDVTYAVPEPGTFALTLCVGAGLLLFVRSRRT